MMKSFRDPVTNILRAWGYVESNGSDVARDEPEGFNLEPGKWRLVNDQWQPYEFVQVPQSVTMRQAREALIRRGQFATVDAYIASMAGIDGQIARNEWDKSQTVERKRPLTLAMGALIGLDAAGLDEWFVFASTL